MGLLGLVTFGVWRLDGRAQLTPEPVLVEVTSVIAGWVIGADTFTKCIGASLRTRRIASTPTRYLIRIAFPAGNGTPRCFWCFVLFYFASFTVPTGILAFRALALSSFCVGSRALQDVVALNAILWVVDPSFTLEALLLLGASIETGTQCTSVVPCREFLWIWIFIPAIFMHSII